MTDGKEHTVPEVIWATPMDGELWEGTFTDKGKLNADAVAYTLKSTTDAEMLVLSEEIVSLRYDLSTARNNALEEAANYCMFLGTHDTEAAAKSIRALKANTP